jgi:hypothetical protein
MAAGGEGLAALMGTPGVSSTLTWVASSRRSMAWRRSSVSAKTYEAVGVAVAAAAWGFATGDGAAVKEAIASAYHDEADASPIW